MSVPKKTATFGWAGLYTRELDAARLRGCLV